MGYLIQVPTALSGAREVHCYIGGPKYAWLGATKGVMRHRGRFIGSGFFWSVLLTVARTRVLEAPGRHACPPRMRVLQDGDPAASPLAKSLLLFPAPLLSET